MKLYRLTRHDADYEELSQALVVAPSEEAARLMVAESLEKRGATRYAAELLDPKKTSCEELRFTDGILLEAWHGA